MYTCIYNDDDSDAGTARKKESSLVDFSISAFAAFSFFRLAAPLSYRRIFSVFYISRVSDLAGILFIINH